jgi:3-phosphoshikimate 1-carboxyvinyltransferase
MADAIIKGRQKLSGKVAAPPSKAYTHRALIAALLSNGVSRISNPLFSEDTDATLKAITTLGAKIDSSENQWTIQGIQQIEKPQAPIRCGESGSTLRFLLPVAALASGPSVFTLGTSLSRRPLAPLLRSLEQLGVKSDFRINQSPPVVEICGGGIKGGKTTMTGDVSSQFVSGLLFGCSKAEADTDILLSTPLESRDYVRMTIEVLNKHGVRMFAHENMTQLKVFANQTYRPFDHDIPGDFSSAAFLLAAAAVTSSKLKIVNLNWKTGQGDQQILNILEKIGCKVKKAEESIEIEGNELFATDVDAKDTPDLVPVCASLACYSQGISRIFNAGRLRLKESDRLSALQMELKKMGGKISIIESGLAIEGPCKMRGATINPHGDHRIAMACAVAALAADGQTVIQNCECVSKSYPGFFDDLSLLGADVVVCR